MTRRRDQAPAAHPAQPPAKRLDSRQVYQGHGFALDLDRVRLPNGKVAEIVLVHHPGAAAIVPVLGGEILLVRQYRYATGGWVLEVPAGTLAAGEAPEACAARELEEETGYRAGHLRPLGWIWTTPGFTDEKIWLFLATGLSPARQKLEDDEVLSVERVPVREAIEKAARGELHDAKSIAALLRAEPFL